MEAVPSVFSRHLLVILLFWANCLMVSRAARETAVWKVNTSRGAPSLGLLRDVLSRPG